jgi:quinol monooxygenase YgiN
LKSAKPLVLQEEGTLRWYAFKIGPATFGIFDTFEDSESRLAHLKGEVAKALLANADQLLAVQPEIQMFDVIASKAPEC